MNALISDFDGTITDHDFFALIANRHMPASTPDYFEQYRAGKLSHFEAMAAYFSHAPAEDAAAIEALLRDTRPDPQLQEGAAMLRRAGWELIVVSAGSSWYIERILGAAGITATIHSNPGRLVPGRGLVLEHPHGSPFFSEEVGVDKAAVVRDALSRYEDVAFAGDGPPDVQPALLVKPERRFARRYLAEELLRRSEHFLPYGQWSEVAWTLASSGAPVK
jgi:2-hydroxy-3-keto-5-methylthiopentenyl-1-phosphate phosphatase